MDFGGDILKDNDEYIIVFTSHNRAQFMYGRIIRKGCENIKLISTPCSISAGCSQSIKFTKECMDLIIKEAEESNSIPKGVYRIVKEEKGEKYEALK